MKTTKLRAILRDRGTIGVLLVGLFLLAYHLWMRRRLSLLVGFLLLAGSALCLCLRPHSARHGLPPTPHAFQIAPSTPLPMVETPEPADPPEDEEVSDHRPLKLLLQQADKLVSLPSHYQAHYWLDRNRVLLISNDGKNYNDFELYGQWNGQADLLDRTTGRHRRLIGLTHRLNEKNCVPEGFDLSPNGKWLAWYYYDTGDRWPIPVFAHLDGSHFQEIRQTNTSETFWLDSHRWAEQETREVEGPLQLKVYDPEDLDASADYRLNSARAKELLRLHRPSYAHTFDVEGTENSSTANHRVQIKEYLTATYDREEGTGLLHSYPVAFPAGTKVAGVLVSQKANRIVYHVRYRARLNSETPPGLLNALWSSHLDGSQLHEIGYVGSDEKEDDASENSEWLCSHLTEVNWIPDDRQVEFCYLGTLYSVSIR